MKTKYLFLSALILVTITSASANRTKFPDSRSELIKIIREQDAKIAELSKEHDRMVILQFEMSIYRKALLDVNVPLPDLSEIENNYVFRSSIQKRFKQPLSVGQVAYLEKNYPKVQQVLDKRNMLVLLQTKVLYRPASPEYKRTGAFRPELEGFPPEQYTEITAGVPDITVWITVISTVGLADNTDFVTDEPFAIKGTRKDDSGNTVFVLEPVKVFPE